jgi:hypothetical protein
MTAPEFTPAPESPAVGAPVQRQVRPRADCPECKGSGARDSGGTLPWGEPVYLPCDCSAAPDYECEDCIGMMNTHGCYCMAMGARQPGGPAA